MTPARSSGFSEAGFLTQRFDIAVHPERRSSYRRLGGFPRMIANRAKSAALQPYVDKIGFEFHFEQCFASTGGKLRTRLSASGEWI
jgi:hypothetical protein